MGRQRMTKHQKQAAHKGLGDVDGLCFSDIRAGVRWAGDVILELARDRAESLLSEYEYPSNSGVFWYCCASTGLLFDKKSGACRQSSRVRLDVASVREQPRTPAQVSAWIAARQQAVYDWSTQKIKLGPKPKGSAPAQESTEDDYAEMD